MKTENVFREVYQTFITTSIIKSKLFLFFPFKSVFSTFWMFLLITNVEFLHQKSSSLTHDKSCDYPKIMIFCDSVRWLGLAEHLQIRFTILQLKSDVKNFRHDKNCKRVGKWEHFCNQNLMHLHRTACHQNCLFVYTKMAVTFFILDTETRFKYQEISFLKLFPKK